MERYALPEGELTPQPHLLEFVTIGWDGEEHRLHEAFKTIAFVGFGMGLFAVAIDYFLEIAHDAVCLEWLLPFRSITKKSGLLSGPRLWTAYNHH